MSFVNYNRKTGKYRNKSFLQEVDQESCGWNIICSDPLICDPALFTAKNSPGSAKSNRISPEGREEIEPWFWHVWIPQWVFTFFFTLGHFRGKREVKNTNFGSVLFHKDSNPLKNFQTMFLPATVLPLVKILGQKFSFLA